jgi:hypothetical protein
MRDNARRPQIPPSERIVMHLYAPANVRTVPRNCQGNIPDLKAVRVEFGEMQKPAMAGFSGVAGAEGFEPRDGELESGDRNQTLSPIREKWPNLFPLMPISNSKRSNFENRTEWVESRGSERNGPFGE